VAHNFLCHISYVMFSNPHVTHHHFVMCRWCLLMAHSGQVIALAPWSFNTYKWRPNDTFMKLHSGAAVLDLYIIVLFLNI